MRNAVLCCLLVLPLVQVQAAETDWYRLGEVGTVRFGLHATRPTGGDVEDGHLSGGAQFVWQAMNYVSLELAAFQMRDTFDETTTDVGIDIDGDIDLDTTAFTLTGRLELPIGDWLGVYGGAGIGYYVFDPDKSVKVTAVEPYAGIGAPTDFDVDTDDQLGFHLAVGLQVFLGRNHEVFAEYQYAYVDADFDFDATVRSVEGELLSSVSDTRSGYDHGLVRVGLNMYF